MRGGPGRAGWAQGPVPVPVLSRPRGTAVGTGTSLALSSLLSLLLFAGMQMYSRQLASTEWLTIQGGLLGSALFVCSLTVSMGTGVGAGDTEGMVGMGPAPDQGGGNRTKGVLGSRARGWEWGWSREDGRWEQGQRAGVGLDQRGWEQLGRTAGSRSVP